MFFLWLRCGENKLLELVLKSVAGCEVVGVSQGFKRNDKVISNAHFHLWPNVLRFKIYLLNFLVKNLGF